MTQTPDPTPTKVVPTRDGYDAWSGTYDTDGNPLVALEEPIVDRHLGAVAGLRVADVGCGTGRHAVRLAQQGADVTALDFSQGMLAQARGKPGAERVRWVHHDLARPLPLAAASFDRVLCALVLDHVADLCALFTELGRICIPGPRGRIVVSVMHPAMMLRGVQARFVDSASGERTQLESVPNHISDYVMGIVGAGLRLVHISEHAGTDELVKLAPRASRYVGWPLLLMMVAEPA